jgi:hypothetical protein
VIVARVLQDPGTRLVFNERLPLTPEAAFLLDLILSETDVYHDLAASASLASRVAQLAGTLADDSAQRAVVLAREVWATTVGELSSIGSLDVVVDLLFDARLRPLRVWAAA